MKTKVAQLLVFVASLLVGALLSQGAPANDDFTNRTVLNGSDVAFTGSLAGASYEAAETNTAKYFSPPGGSVWWTWTAPVSSRVVIVMLRDYSVADSARTTFAVYEGSDLSSLTWVDDNSFDAPGVRYVAFTANAGESYQFRLAGGWFQPLTFQLTVTNSPIFLIQPQDCTASPYGSALFTAATTDVGLIGLRNPPTTAYQWTFNDAPLPGERYPTLIIHGITTNHAGSYSLIASNAGGISRSTRPC